MRRRVLALVALLLSAFGLHAADKSKAAEKVEITGDYLFQVGCHKTFHEEISFVVEPGKDKFSGTRHAISLTAEQKKELRSGVKVKITGKKQPRVQKKMTKGAVRKAMYKHLKKSEGMPLHCKGMGEILSKIAVKAEAKAGAHDHGTLELKAVDDDAEEVDITIMPHVVVETLEIVK